MANTYKFYTNQKDIEADDLKDGISQEKINREDLSPQARKIQEQHRLDELPRVDHIGDRYSISFDYYLSAARFEQQLTQKNILAQLNELAGYQSNPRIHSEKYGYNQIWIHQIYLTEQQFEEQLFATVKSDSNGERRVAYDLDVNKLMNRELDVVTSVDVGDNIGTNGETFSQGQLKNPESHMNFKNVNDRMLEIINNDKYLYKLHKENNNKIGFLTLYAVSFADPNQLTKEAVHDILLFDIFRNQKQKKDSDFSSVEESKKYYNELNSFLKNAIAIRLSDKLPEVKYNQLKDLAHTSFSTRDFWKRLAADFLLVLSCCAIVGFGVGLYRKYKTSAKSFFFSTESTQREKDFALLSLETKGSALVI